MVAVSISRGTRFTSAKLPCYLAIIRPKVETELSIQDRHPTRKCPVPSFPFDAKNCTTVLFLDLLKNYDNILPPTIARKQRESERRVPVRKRTAPVDLRMSRSRISVGAPTRELLAAQQAAQKLASQSDIDAPTSLPATRTEEPIIVAAEPESIEAFAPEHHVPEPSTQEDDTVPPRPVFKEPPPEMDDMPPRPAFREPPPEVDDAPPPRPTFVSPPASPPVVVEEKPAPSPAVAVTPATPQNPIKSIRRNSAFHSGSPSPVQARSPSPSITAGGESATEDQPLTHAKPGLTRHTSGQPVVRGPRLSRAPRTSQSGSVSGKIAAFNNRSAAASPPPSPGYKRLSGGTSRLATNAGADLKRGIGRTPGGLSRRTMASDAEDEVVDK